MHQSFYCNIVLFSREGSGTPLQYSCLENPMDGGAWQAAVHGIAKSRTQLSNFTFHFYALEKEMATHSSILAWRIPGTEEPGGLQSTGLQRVGHNWSKLIDLLLLFCLLLCMIIPELGTEWGREMRYSTFLEKLTVYSKTCLICKALEISQGRI